MHSSAALDWNDLRYLLSVAEAGSLAGAARILGVNHTTVLRRVSSFEQRLGVRAFDRLPNGYVLTPAGEELVAAARQVELTVAAVERRVLGRDLRLTGTVRLTTTDTLVVSLLPPVLQAFRALHPDVTLELATSNTVASLSRREADIALRPTRKPDEALVGRRIASVHFAVYAARAARAVQSLAELGQALWVGPDDSLAATTIARWMRANVNADRVVLRADSLVAMREAAIAGLGIAALPCYLADRTPELVRVHDVIPAMATELWILTHEDLRNAARIRAVMEFLTDELGRQSDVLEGRGAPR